MSDSQTAGYVLSDSEKKQRLSALNLYLAAQVGSREILIPLFDHLNAHLGGQASDGNVPGGRTK